MLSTAYLKANSSILLASSKNPPKLYLIQMIVWNLKIKSINLYSTPINIELQLWCQCQIEYNDYYWYWVDSMSFVWFWFHLQYTYYWTIWSIFLSTWALSKHLPILILLGSKVTHFEKTATARTSRLGVIFIGNITNNSFWHWSSRFPSVSQ